MASKWIEHIKEYAKANGMTYRDALKDPKCKTAYQSGKGLAPKGIKEGEENVKMIIAEKKRRGRPPKYTTDEERKKAKSIKTMESNKRKKALKEKPESESSSDSEMEGEGMKGFPNPLKVADKETKKVIKELQGKGILAGYTAENTNGLAHIYPISHDLVLQMLSCCPKK